jgi:hypothetical protein
MFRALRSENQPAAQLDPAILLSHIVAGTTAQTGSQLTVFENTSQGITAIATIPVRGPATSLAFGNLSGDRFPDSAIVAARPPQCFRHPRTHDMLSSCRRAQPLDA